MLFFLFLLLVPTIEASAKLSDELEVPSELQAFYIKKLSMIILCWKDIHSTTQYQVKTTMSDASTHTFNRKVLETLVSEPSFVLKNISPDPATYTFAVRLYLGNEFSQFSKEVTVDVTTSSMVPLNNTVMIMKVNSNNTHIFTWRDLPTTLADVNNHNYFLNVSYPRLSCLTFTMETCLRVETFREWTTNESLVSDVRVLEYFNPSTNKTETLYKKNHTIHYDKHHIESLGFNNVSCQSVSSDQLRFDIDVLEKGFNYSFVVRVYLGSKLLGRYDDGVFEALGYIPPDVYVEEIFTGIVIYGLACGILIFTLMSSFIIALICRWERLMSDLAIHKEKVRTRKMEEMDKKLKTKLLSEDFVNEQPQLHVDSSVGNA